MKTLCLFAYHIINVNVLNFINNCIFEDEDIDFYLISNNRTNKINVPPFCKIMYRENIGFEFGAWSDCLLSNDLYKNYDNFIFVNSSVKGPFLSPHYKGKWTNIYLNGLQGNVKLFGSTINTLDNPIHKAHVQSYIFSMNKVTLEFLIGCHIFSTKNIAVVYAESVYLKEILMSRKIIENGWNIGSLLSCYKDVDFTFKSKKMIDYENLFFGDVMIPEYENKLWTQNELVFII